MLTSNGTELLFWYGLFYADIHWIWIMCSESKRCVLVKGFAAA